MDERIHITTDETMIEKTLKLYREILDFKLVDALVVEDEELLLLLDEKEGNNKICLCIKHHKKVQSSKKETKIILRDKKSSIINALLQIGYRMDQIGGEEDQISFHGCNGELIIIYIKK